MAEASGPTEDRLAASRERRASLVISEKAGSPRIRIWSVGLRWI